MGHRWRASLGKAFQKSRHDGGGEISTACATACATAVATAVVGLVLAKAAWFGRLLGASQSLPNWSILGLCVLFALLGAGVAVLALKRNIDHLNAALIKEKERARRDPLTRLYNQGNVKTVLKQRLAEVGVNGETFSVILIDVDDFKMVNNRFGHEGGNRVLEQIAETLSRSSRAAGDIVCRFGGDEFLVIMQNRAADIDPSGGGIPAVDEGYNVAERLRRQIGQSRLVVEIDGHRWASITVSCGAVSVMAGDTPESLLTRVSLALRKAKEPRSSPGVWFCERTLFIC